MENMEKNAYLIEIIMIIEKYLGLSKRLFHHNRTYHEQQFSA